MRRRTAAWQGGRRRAILWLIFSCILLLACAIRIVLIVRAPGILDGDEALVGLQAEGIATNALHPWPIFFFGQDYMGSFEAYLAAAMFRLFFPSVVVLRVVPLLFSLLFILVTGLFGGRILGARGAAIAAALAALPPLYPLVWSIKARGGYIETLALGSMLLLLTHHLVYGPQAAHRDERGSDDASRSRIGYGGAMMGAWGAVAGLLVWINPLSLSYVAAGGVCLLVLAYSRWRGPGRPFPVTLFGPLALGVLVGGLPLWLASLSNGGATWGYLSSGAAGSGIVERVPRVASFLLTAIVPKLLGAWEPWSSPLPRPVGGAILIAYGVATVLFVWGWREERRGNQRGRGRGIVLLFGGLVVLLFVVSGFGASALNVFKFDSSSRYMLPLMSIVPLVAADAIERLWRRWRILALAVLVAVLVVDGAGLLLARSQDVFQSEYWTRLPASQEPLLHFLQRHRIRSVWMNHWAGYPLMFVADGAIAAADYNDVIVHGGPDRLPWTLRRAAADPRAAYVLVTADTSPPLVGLLRAHKAQFRTARIGPYLVFWDMHPVVPPGEVTAGIGFAY